MLEMNATRAELDEKKEAVCSRVHDTGKRSAVYLNSGSTVDRSVPALKEPTPPLTAGRKPEACPSQLQRKSGRERESGALAQSVGAADAINSPIRTPSSPEPLDAESLARLIGFFRKLDQWDRQITSQEVM